MKTSKIITITAVFTLAAVAYGLISTQAGADSELIRRQCLIKANQTFLTYLESNSTTYKFDDGTIINLPNEDNVIKEAKIILEKENSKC